MTKGYKERYKKHLKFSCSWCGARRGQACETYASIICQPHEDRWHKMRASVKKADTKKKEKEATTADIFQSWLMDRAVK